VTSAAPTQSTRLSVTVWVSLSRGVQMMAIAAIPAAREAMVQRKARQV
jgi:hypothetical protein